ncbi:MAG: apolipoprotein N-acyltransferase [Desulfobacter sp.]|nr:MAG: apolipoprotein N-acyltransferase [Desulfobacter sp.]
MSGILLGLGTPSIGLWQFSFFAFIPLLTAIQYQFDKERISFWAMYGLGVLFSYIYASFCFYWLSNLSLSAMFAVPAIYAVVCGFFVPGVILGMKSRLKNVGLYLWMVFLWVSLEVILSDTFFAIPSIALGYLLWPVTPMIQTADITGVFGTSFWILLVNVLILSLFQKGLKRSLILFSIVLLITIVIAGYGQVKINQKKIPKCPSITINTIYTSVKTKDKEKRKSRKRIFKLLKQKTVQSIDTSNDSPDLVIWPETSVPVYLRSFREKEFIEDLIGLARKYRLSILIGALSFKVRKDQPVKQYNTAFLVPDESYISQEYHKKILVPFTEKNPFEKFLPHKISTKFKSEFDAGKHDGIINLSNGITFGTIICYEAFFPDFVRKLAIKDIGFIVNITNDHHAFKTLMPAYEIPLSHLVFRAVENRKHLVRSANWGYSLVVSPMGELVQCSSIGQDGYFTSKIIPPSCSTFFSKHGFLFARILLILTMVWLIIIFVKVKNLNK